MDSGHDCGPEDRETDYGSAARVSPETSPKGGQLFATKEMFRSRFYMLSIPLISASGLRIRSASRRVKSGIIL